MRNIRIAVLIAALIVGYLVFFAKPSVPRISPFQVNPVVTTPITRAADGSLPWAPTAAVDLNGDGVPEVVVGGGRNQPDAIMRVAAIGLTDVAPLSGMGEAKPMATLAIAAIDVDRDADTDLYVAREDGIYLWINQTPQVAPGTPAPVSGVGGAFKFEVRKLSLPLPPDTVPVGIAIADLNRNRLPDLLVATLPASFMDDGDALAEQVANTPVMLLVDDTSGSYVDGSANIDFPKDRSAVSVAFADMNDDRLVDAVMALQDGRVVILINKGDLTFTTVLPPTGINFISAMALADYDNDGLLDIFLAGAGEDADIDSDARGTVGGSGFALLQNQGKGMFTNIALGVNFTHTGRAYGVTVGDLDGNGRPEVVVGLKDGGWAMFNYYPSKTGAGAIYFPADPDQAKDMPSDAYFQEAAAAGLPTEGTGITPLLVDLDNNGIHDLVLVPQEGDILAFGGPPRMPPNSYLKVRIPLTADIIGSRLSVAYPSGPGGQQSAIRFAHIISGTGNGGDVATIPNLSMSGQEATVLSAQLANGRNRSLQRVTSNQLVKLD